MQIKGALAISWENTPVALNRVAIGSVSLLDRRTGLNASIALGKSFQGAKPSYIYFKGGWNGKVYSSGKSKLVFELFQGSDYVTGGSRSRMWGVGAIQEFDRQGLEVYAGYRDFSYDDLGGLTYQDTGALQIGARWSF